MTERRTSRTADARGVDPTERDVLLSTAIGVIGELSAAYEMMPLGFDLGEPTDVARARFASRLNLLERSRTAQSRPE